MMRCTVAVLAVMLLTPPISEPSSSGVRPEIAEAIKRLRSGDAAERQTGLKRLLAAGKNARPAWPLLIHILHDPSVGRGDRTRTIFALDNIADPEDEAMSRAIVRALLHSLSTVEADESEARWSVSLLRRHPGQLRRAVPELRKLLALDRPGEVNRLAEPVILLLADCGMDGYDVLVEAASHREFANRYLAVDCLGDFGTLARPALPVILESLNDENDSVRVLTANAMLRIDRQASLGRAVSTLARILETDGAHSSQVMGILRDLGPDAAASVPALRKALRHPERLPQKLAVLRAIGPAAADAVPDLCELLDGSAAHSRVDIAHTLWCIAPPPQKRLALAVLLDRAEVGERQAIPVLGQLGRGVPGVWETLLRRRGELDEETALELALALWRTAPVGENADQRWDGREEAVDDLGELLFQGDSRSKAFAVIRVIGPGAARLVPRLRTMLDHPNPLKVARVAAALGDIGPPARSAVPRLWKLANDHGQPPELRVEAALAVARIDLARAEEAISTFCRESNFETWVDLAELARFGPQARAAVPRLRELLTSAELDTRRVAADALWRIDPDEARRLGVIRPAPMLGEEARP